VHPTHWLIFTQVEAQATLASLVKVSSMANGVDVDVFHNAILDVPAVVEIAELGAANDFNEGGTASLGAAREASQGGEVKMVQVRTASVDLVAREVFGADATIDFLKIDVEGVEPCINQIVAARRLTPLDSVIMAAVLPRRRGIRLTV
jgi:hypothetical protein